MKKVCKSLAVIGLLLVVALGLTGCKKKENPVDESKLEITTSTPTPTLTPTPTPDVEVIPEGMVNSYLTGEYIVETQGRRRPVAVMLNNIIDAVPQYGISRAGVVYEAPVEGKITRLMGIFENYDDLEKIGSVRSCREYYIFYALEFDAIYAHYGQAAYAVNFLEQDFVNNLSGLSNYGRDIYYRTQDRKAPHNAYTSYEGIQRGIADYGYSQEYSADYDGHYQFCKVGESVELSDEDDAYTANKVNLLCFNENKPWFEYDTATQKYKRFQYGNAHIDEMTGEQLSFDNIIIQYTSYVPYDANGYLNLDTISGGEGIYITQGKAIPIRWEKDSVWGVTHYITADEQEITMNTGTTFVEIVLNDTIDKVTIE